MAEKKGGTRAEQAAAGAVEPAQQHQRQHDGQHCPGQQMPRCTHVDTERVVQHADKGGVHPAAQHGKQHRQTLLDDGTRLVVVTTTDAELRLLVTTDE